MDGGRHTEDKLTDADVFKWTSQSPERNLIDFLRYLEISVHQHGDLHPTRQSLGNAAKKKGQTHQDPDVHIPEDWCQIWVSGW